MSIKPRLKDIGSKPRPFYGSEGLTSRRATHIKSNCICSNPDCNYSAKVWILGSENSESQKNSFYSLTCPIHRTPLINIGYASLVPKAKSKERAELIKKYKKEYTLKYSEFRKHEK